VTSTLNGISANLLEEETQDMQIIDGATNYPTYSRAMSGIAEGYSILAFAQYLPFTSYVQALPDIMTFTLNAQ